jgi:hypothetical protein
MATRRPALHTLPGSERFRGRDLEREVSAMVRRQLDDACERAWADIAHRFSSPPLFPKDDPAAPAAQQAIAALLTLLTRGLSRLAVAALLLAKPRPRLTSLVGGGSRNGHAADVWRPGKPSSSV